MKFIIGFIVAFFVLKFIVGLFQDIEISNFHAKENEKEEVIDRLKRYIELYHSSVYILLTEYRNKFKNGENWDVISDVPEVEKLYCCGSIRHLVDTRQKMDVLIDKLPYKEFFHEGILYKSLSGSFLEFSIEEIVMISVKLSNAKLEKWN